MKTVAGMLLVALLAIGCGGGGSTGSLGNAQSQDPTVTYAGQFFNASSQALGTATVRVTGASLQATCVPYSNLGTTFLITGTFQNGVVIAPTLPPRQIATGSITGNTITLNGFDDTNNTYGIINVIAASNQS